MKKIIIIQAAFFLFWVPGCRLDKPNKRGENIRLEYYPACLFDRWTLRTATWYARPGSRWWKRIPALGLRDGTRRSIADYCRLFPCVAVPIQDTTRHPLGSWVWLWGARGQVRALVVDVNIDTTYDLAGDLFPLLCGEWRKGREKILVRR